MLIYYVILRIMLELIIIDCLTLTVVLHLSLLL